MRLYRICHVRYLQDFRGLGASYRDGARWNEPGFPIVYFAETPSVAMLEMAHYCHLPVPRRIRHEIRNFVRRERIRKHQHPEFVGQRVQALHQYPVTNQGPCTATTRLGGHDDHAHGAIRAGDALPQDEHEDRRVQYPYYASICLSKLGFLPRLSKYSIVSLLSQQSYGTPLQYAVLIEEKGIFHFASRSDVYVSGNMLMYYEEGNLRKSVAPDVFVVLGANRDKDRDTYLMWREPKAPDFVLEVTSKSTRKNDLVTKRSLYEALGVAEYFLFDPRAEYLNPPLLGFALRDGRYAPVAATRLVDGARALHSETLGLSLRLRGQALRLHDPAIGKDLLTPEEAEEDEAAARRAIEAENSRLRARIHTLERSARASEPPS